MTNLIGALRPDSNALADPRALLHSAEGNSTWKRFRRRFMRHKPAVAGLIMLLVLVFGAIFAPLAALGVDPYAVDFALINAPPMAGHILGTDGIGRDVWARLAYGARISLSIGLVVTSINTLIAVVIGGISGYFGGWVDTLLQRFTEAVMLFPEFILIITVSSLLKPSIYNVMIVLGMFGWPGTSRVVRSVFLSVRETNYVSASRALGVRWPRLIFHHILPAATAPLIVAATLGLVGAIMTETTLSFLGLGVQEPTPSWGSMLQHAMQLPVLRHMWWRWVPPAVLISLSVLSVNFIGDGLRDAADPTAYEGLQGKEVAE